MSTEKCNPSQTNNAGPDPAGSPRANDFAKRSIALIVVTLKHLWQELRLVAMATASQVWRLIQYGIVAVRLRLAARTLDRTQVVLGEKLYQSGLGDRPHRDSIGALDVQIQEKRTAKQSVTKLLTDRRRLLISLAETVPPGDGTASGGPEQRDVRSRQQDLDERRRSAKSLRAGLMPGDLTEVRRVAMGFGIIVFAIIAFGMFVPSMQRNAASQFIAAALKDAMLVSDPFDQASAYSKIAKAQAKTGDLIRVRQTLAKAKAAAAKISRELGKTLAYGEIAKVQAEIGDVAEALATAAQISGEDVKARVYSRIAESQAMVGDGEGASKSIEKAQAAAAQVSRKETKALAYRDIAEAQARTGDVAGAKATADQTGSFNRSTYCKIAVAQAEAGDGVGARESLAKAQAMAAQISLGLLMHIKAEAYRDIAEAQVKVGDTAGARDSLEKAKVTAAQIISASDQAFAYIEIARGQAKIGDVAGARDSLEKAKATAAQMSNESWKSTAYAGVAEAQAESGDVAEAKVTAGQITSDVDKVDAYSKITGAQAEAGNLAGARETLGKAQAAASQISSKDAAGTTYCELVKAQAKVGDVAGGISLMTSVEPSLLIRCTLLARVAEELCPVRTKPVPKQATKASHGTPGKVHEQSGQSSTSRSKINSTAIDGGQLVCTNKMPLADGLYLSISFMVMNKSEPKAQKLNGLAGLVFIENLTTVNDYKLTERTTATLRRGSRSLTLTNPTEKDATEYLRVFDFASLSATELLALLKGDGEMSLEIGGRKYELDKIWTQHVSDLIETVEAQKVRFGYR